MTRLLGFCGVFSVLGFVVFLLVGGGIQEESLSVERMSEIVGGCYDCPTCYDCKPADLSECTQGSASPDQGLLIECPAKGKEYSGNEYTTYEDGDTYDVATYDKDIPCWDERNCVDDGVKSNHHLEGDECKPFTAWYCRTCSPGSVLPNTAVIAKHYKCS